METIDSIMKGPTMAHPYDEKQYIELSLKKILRFSNHMNLAILDIAVNFRPAFAQMLEI